MIITISILVVVTVFLTISYIDLSARYSSIEDSLADLDFNNNDLYINLVELSSKLDQLTPKKPVKNTKVKTK